jgi:hypothetical protein
MRELPYDITCYDFSATIALNETAKAYKEWVLLHGTWATPECPRMPISRDSGGLFLGSFPPTVCQLSGALKNPCSLKRPSRTTGTYTSSFLSMRLDSSEVVIP